MDDLCPALRWLVWHSGNGVCHINEVMLRRARLELGLVTTAGLPSRYFSRPLSLAILPRVGVALRICRRDSDYGHVGRPYVEAVLTDATA